jgi:hypothetical protein
MVNPKPQCCGGGGGGGGMSNVKKVNNNNKIITIIIIIIKLLDYYSMMTTLGHWISFYLKELLNLSFMGEPNKSWANELNGIEWCVKRAKAF